MHFVLAGGKRPARVDRDTIDGGSPSVGTNRFKRLRKGPAPARTGPTPQVSHCEAPDAPSSSLSISDDVDDFLSGGQHHEQPKPQAAPRAPSSLSLRIEDEDDDFFLAGNRQPEPTLALPVPGQSTPVISENAAGGVVWSLEDEIEDWTTDEDLSVRDVPPSVGSCSTSGNSKSSLLNRGVLMTQSATKANTSKFTQTPNTSASISLEESCTKKLLPKITVSPMRKIYLLDSDTDAEDDHNQNKVKTLQQNRKPQRSSTVQQQTSSSVVELDTSASISLEESCTKKLLPKITVSPIRKIYLLDSDTDAEDDHNQNKVKTLQQNRKPQRSSTVQQQTSSSVADDGHFAVLFHPEPSVGNLFWNRLQHFIPIGAGSIRENGQNRAESLSSRRRQFSSSAAASDDRVTLGRISVPIPTDASKRRVHASGSHSGSGHWFTNDSGRKVYVSENGQELTGRDAYRQYQKESGRGQVQEERFI